MRFDSMIIWINLERSKFPVRFHPCPPSLTPNLAKTGPIPSFSVLLCCAAFGALPFSPTSFPAFLNECYSSVDTSVSNQFIFILMESIPWIPELLIEVLAPSKPKNRDEATTIIWRSESGCKHYKVLVNCSDRFSWTWWNFISNPNHGEPWGSSCQNVTLFKVVFKTHFKQFWDILVTSPYRAWLRL